MTRPPNVEASGAAPSPGLLFDTVNAYQKTAAIKAAIELDLFTPLANGPMTSEKIATHIKASPRGVRILCDYLTVLGFLTKAGDSPDARQRGVSRPPLTRLRRPHARVPPAPRENRNGR